MPDSEFSRAASERPTSFLGEVWQFVRHNKKWWLIPIICTLLLVTLLVVFAGTGAAPFVYTLF
ncbi:MAG TPA: DUF5989 family protein [Mycobacterium sp.]|nr:DUF5989 family protein [Mycobacterium sp.]